MMTVLTKQISFEQEWCDEPRVDCGIKPAAPAVLKSTVVVAWRHAGQQRLELGNVSSGALLMKLFVSI